jgi:hypothetical protein
MASMNGTIKRLISDEGFIFILARVGCIPRLWIAEFDDRLAAAVSNTC